MKFNINYNVKVRLTDHGRELLKADHDAFNEEIGGTFGEWSPVREDKDGWSTWQLWVLMEAFGGHMSCTGNNPFDLEIEILEGEAHE